MGLIYVNPEGPNGTPDPLAAARDIRETFGRMAMNDEETVALIAGGHTFARRTAPPMEPYTTARSRKVPPSRAGTGLEEHYGVGNAGDSISSGLEGAWTPSPIKWDNSYFDTLFGHEWVQSRSPAGATQWVPKDGGGANTVPDAHDPVKLHAPIMFTTDLALRLDPSTVRSPSASTRTPISSTGVCEGLVQTDAPHMGPHVRSLGPWVPSRSCVTAPGASRARGCATTRSRAAAACGGSGKAYTHSSARLAGVSRALPRRNQLGLKHLG